MYAIMKSTSSLANPLLVEWKDWLGNVSLMFGKLGAAIQNPELRLMTFGSVSEARAFISAHPGVCDDRCVVCEGKFGPENRSVSFEPIKN